MELDAMEISLSVNEVSKFRTGEEMELEKHFFLFSTCVNSWGTLVNISFAIKYQFVFFR